MDELKLVKQRARGQRVERLLRDPDLKEAFELVEKRIIDDWLASLPDEQTKRERLYHSAQALGNVEQVLKSVIYTGEIASKDLMAIETKDKQSG